MIRNENIICISSIDWDFIWQGHQEIMSTFAQNGNRVLFIENTGIRSPKFEDVQRLKKRIVSWFKSVKGFRKEMENLYVYSPIILPFPYSRVARFVNKYLLIRSIKRWMKAMGFRNPIIWTFLPTGTALDIINNIEGKLLIYYCIANFYELADNPKKVKQTEDELIKKCDLIFAQGKVIQEKCRRLNDNVYIFPFGVNMKVFEDFQQSSYNAPPDIKDIKMPIIGYIGGIHKHIDFDLLKFISQNNPEWSIVLVGPVQTDTYEIGNLKNIFLLGKKDFKELPYYINEFDVCIIPYLKSGYTATVYPTKLNEYHALGKPVISTDLPEVKVFNDNNGGVVYIGKDYEDFSKNIVNALKEDGDGKKVERITAAEKNGWQNRIEEMSVIINKVIEDKRNKGEVGWEKTLVGIYNSARRKVVKVSFAILFLYYLIFYSPLIWYMAEPLKIVQQPKKVDAIVVFGGGAGESGVAGQGYEERVTYAVDLFKKGYAEHIIFSSGYTNILKEPDIMKALAISLGVPDNAIIIETESSNTYKNVLNAKRILKEREWNKILLVSSPYHIRRVSLVFRKNAKEIDVIYTPTPNSQFYSYDIGSKGGYFFRKTTLNQLEGFKHEYLGIIYYWWKGYI